MRERTMRRTRCSARAIAALAGLATTIGGRGYAVRLVHQGSVGPDPVIEVSGGEFRSIRALLRERRREGYGAPRRTRVRGRRGYLLKRRSGHRSAVAHARRLLRVASDEEESR